MTTETQNLLSLLYQAGAELQIKDGLLLVGPPAIAQKFGERIKRLKPEIMLALGHCPKCGEELIGEKVRRLDREGKRVGKGVFIHCQNRDHYEEWEI